MDFNFFQKKRKKTTIPPLIFGLGNMLSLLLFFGVGKNFMGEVMLEGVKRNYTDI